MSVRRLALLLCAATGMAGAVASTARAAPVVALTGDRTLVFIDSAGPAVQRSVNVTNISGRLLGIDVRPADNRLYGVTSGGTVVTINRSTGAATFKSTLATRLPANVRASIDFNPAADRLRMIGSDGTNLRANVDDGTVTTDLPLNFVAPDPFGGTTPSVVAAAYSNSVAGTKTTLLFDIDSGTDALYLQLPPNNGTLNAVGRLGIEVGPIGFDIERTNAGRNIGWLITNNRLWQLDLPGGRLLDGKPIRGLDTAVRDIAVLD